MSSRISISPKLAKLILSVLILFSTSCNDKVPPPVRIGTIVWPGYEFLYLARTLGYFDGMPIQLVEYTSSSEVLRAFKNNTLEAITLTADEFLRLAEEQPDVRAIAVLDVSFGADAILGQPSINNLAQLKGKRVGVEPNSVGTVLLMYALEEAGLKKNDVILVHSRNHEQEEMFREGEIDAVATFEPIKSRVMKRGATLLFDSSMIPGKIVDLLVVRKSMLDGQSDRLAHILKSWFKARDFYLKQPQKGAELMAPRENLTPLEFIQAMNNLASPSPAENQALLGAGDRSLGPKLESMVKFLHRHSLLQTVFDPTPHLDGTIVNKMP